MTKRSGKATRNKTSRSGFTINSPRKTSGKSSPASATTSGLGTIAGMKESLRAKEREYRLVEANERLSRELLRAKGHTADLVDACYRALLDAAAGLVIPPVPPPHVQKCKGAEEKAIVVVSDLQLAKTTPTYNTQVAEERMEKYASKVITLTNIQRGNHPVNEARVYLLGDIVEGELIFPSQPHQIDASLYRQVAVDGPRILTNFLRSLLASFTRVHVVGVIGNHGAIGGRERRLHNPETNADRMLYQFVRQLLAEEPRLTWNIPYEKNERAWYAVDHPFGQDEDCGDPTDKLRRYDTQHGFLLFHGDQIPGSPNHSVGTVARHIYGLASGAIPEPFNHAIYGHWHSPRYYELNKIKVWCNGSTESTNTYAQERLAAMGTPSQLLLFVHPRQGVTSEYRVRL